MTHSDVHLKQVIIKREDFKVPLIGDFGGLVSKDGLRADAMYVNTLAVKFM